LARNLKYVADALSRTKIEETMFIPEEAANNADATVHSAQEDNQNKISITERKNKDIRNFYIQESEKLLNDLEKNIIPLIIKN